MPIHVLFLVLASAVVHVGWNVLARAAPRGSDFSWRVNVAGALMLLPLVLVRRVYVPWAIDGELLRLAALSALFEAIYFLLLERAYATADLSVVYPLSRGVAPLLVLLPARGFTGDALGASALVGIAVATIGIALIAGRSTSRRALLLALATGAATAAYQLVDRRAMQRLSADSALDYLAVMQAVLALLLSAVHFEQRGRRENRRRQAQLVGPRTDETSGLPDGTRVSWRPALLAAAAIQLAYLLVLDALADGKGNVTLVSAARNVGIPLSLLAGWLFFREPVGRRRIVGAIVLVAGVLLTLKLGR